MKRKILFLVFTNEPCRRNHAFLYAIDLARHGHDVRLLLEGEGVQCLREREERFGELFEEARGLGLLVGVCKAASAGCSDASRDVTRLAEESGLALVATLDGHAGIAEFVEEGYEVITF
ncbi:MAG: DsrE family protein [Deltaproteobacteria bacterium]|nr:DsrE family protein [Deltaproteobacteria bacterium]